MPTYRLHNIAAALVAAGTLSIGVVSAADKPQSNTQKSMRTADRGAVNKIVAGWTPGPQLAAQEMMAKYGAPQEVTSERLVWHNAGPFKRITLTKQEFPHDFPITHMDYLEHTISYNMPPDKADEVLAFDGSITIYRVGGELSARCDLESNNVLTFNLAHDVATGKRSVEEARKVFGETVTERNLGKNPPLAMALQFDPQKTQAAGDTDQITIAGTPQRAQSAAAADKGGDAEIMALVIAVDENEVHAASAAEQKKISGPVLDYARMLHTSHGKNMQDTVNVGKKLGITPVETAAVEQLHNKGAAQLAKVVPLNGDEFNRAFLAMMVAGHTEALQMLDNSLKTAQNEELKKHLTDTRQEVAQHLEQAKQLQGNARVAQASVKR